MEQFEQVIAFDGDDDMQKKWKAFCRKIDTKTDSFDVVLRTIKEFLAEPLSAALINNAFEKSWSANDNRWTQGGSNNG